jgi:hypothetical protein
MFRHAHSPDARVIDRNMAAQPDKALSVGLIRRNIGRGRSSAPVSAMAVLSVIGGQRRIARWFGMPDRRRLTDRDPPQQGNQR